MLSAALPELFFVNCILEYCDRCSHHSKHIIQAEHTDLGHLRTALFRTQNRSSNIEGINLDYWIMDSTANSTLE